MTPKETLILDCALKLLIETGDAGLTLRKLADAAGMRLSNVQYYFKSRDEVLKAMVAQYFGACIANLEKLLDESNAKTARERVRFLALSGLAHGIEISDMCRAFREIWAISSRNEIIDQALMNYYQSYADAMARFACPTPTTEAKRHQLASLLVTFFEGYSITGRALPMTMEQAADMLTDMAMSIVGEPAVQT